MSRTQTDANLALTHDAKQALFNWRFSILRPPPETWDKVTEALALLEAYERDLAERVLAEAKADAESWPTRKAKP